MRTQALYAVRAPTKQLSTSGPKSSFRNGPLNITTIDYDIYGPDVTEHYNYMEQEDLGINLFHTPLEVESAEEFSAAEKWPVAETEMAVEGSQMKREEGEFK